MHHSRPTDHLSTSRKVPEKGIAKRVVKDFIYAIFFAGTIKKCAKGFPECLKSVKPAN